MKVFEARGTFLIPGSREKGDFGPQMVAAETIQKASRDVAKSLNEKYREELAQANKERLGTPFKFSPDFGMYNLKWTDITAKRQETAVKIALIAMTQIPAVNPEYDLWVYDLHIPSCLY